MRAAAALVIGLIGGGVVGFALAGWLRDDASRAERAELRRESPEPAAAPALPAPTWGQPERLTAPPAPAAGTPASAEVQSPVSAAADALVGILVHGAVLDGGGRPAALGEWNALQFDSGRGAPRSVEVGPDSTYAISGLTPGAWTVSLDSQGWRPWRKELTLDAAQPVVRLDITLQPAVVLDIKAFTPSGEPLEKVLQGLMSGGDSWNARLGAIATLEPPPAALPEISHRLYEHWGIGHFHDAAIQIIQDEALPEDVLGRLELDEPLPAYVSLMFRHLVLATQPVEPGASEVSFVVPPSALEALLGGVRLRVVDEETSQPLSNAYANLFDSQSSGGGMPSDASGVFEWTRQRPGLLELSVSAPDHEKWDGEVSVPPGGVADLGTLELSPAMAARGVVLDGDGQPHSVNLRALPDEPRGQGKGARRYVKSGADGRFEWTTLGRRRYRVLVSDDEWTALPVLVDLRGGDVNDLRITVVQGTSVRLLTRWPPSQTYDLRVETDGGLVISRSDAWQADWAWTKRLAPGAYVAVVSQAGRDLRRVPFQVGAADLSVEVGP